MIVELLADGAGIGWRPGIGDPSWTGWLTVIAYALAACLSGLAWRACRVEARRLGHADPREARNQRLLARFWLLAGVMLIALGINKQLDVQSLFTEVLRNVAHVQGWYDERRRYQFRFVVGIAGAGVVGVAALAWALRDVIGRVWLAVVGLGWMTSFVIIRAASFHHVDSFLRSVTQVGNAALELSGILMIAAGAGLALRGRRVP